MNDLDAVLRMSEETLVKLVRSAQADLFFEIIRSIKEFEANEEIDGAKISELVELRFKDKF